MILEKLEVKEWLELNAKLQQKKNALRKALKEKGILKKGAANKFDNYSYFSEAQYKELFTGLFSEHGLELKSSESDYTMFAGTEKQANGRIVKFEFNLCDIDTGFFETSYVTGEGIDKGDKAGYKADTGALKFYLANTFMVATGDDPDKESPDNKMNDKKATPKQVEMLEGILDDEEIEKVIQHYKIERLEDLTLQQASSLINRKKGAK